jgi:hypothetical protein
MVIRIKGFKAKIIHIRRCKLREKQGYGCGQHRNNFEK